MRRLALAALILALAACSPKPAETAGKAPEAAPAAVAAKLQPGQWRTTTTIAEMAVPGMPKGALDLKPIVTEDCITSDDIAAFTNRSAMHDADEGVSCVSDSMTVSGNTIKGSSTCSGGEGGTRKMEMAGTYGPARVDMTVQMTGESPRGSMSTKMTMVSERIGDCPR